MVNQSLNVFYLIPLLWKTYTLLVHITRTHYSYTLLVHITRTHYSYTLLVHITRTHYSYTLLVHITRTQYSYTVLVHITRTHYSYTLLVHITRTHYSYTLLVRTSSYTVRALYKHYTYTKYPYLCVLDSINRYKWALQTCVKITCTGSVNT